MLKPPTIHTEDATRQSRCSGDQDFSIRGIVHDFSNLIQITRGTIELLQYDTDSKPNAQRLLTALQALDKMAELAFDLRDGFRLVAVSWPQVKHAIQDALRLGSETQPVSWTIIEQPGLPTILGDIHEIGRIFLNLTWNACDAQSATPNIQVVAEVCSMATAPGQDASSALADEAKKWLRIDFTDNGAGMSLPQQAHLFESNFSTKGADRGLGLATVRSLMHGHGGEITVQSQLGQGCTFHLYFPVSGPPLPKH
ncbi:MAG: HAMP domain-containing histidine kinase [Firmicutes bacterium]|nr:HAMP domain-containing histidine kinase [Bacillota bacterium]MCL5066189.1 HAMP domain-containing histidine kinase [Bacillota bacterium]